MSPLRTLQTVFAIVLWPAAVFAGPIDFNYTATTESVPGIPSPGPLNLDVLKGGHVRFGDYGGQFTIGHAEFGWPPGPQSSDTYTATTPFHMGIHIKNAIGHSRDLGMDGAAIDDWVLRSWDGRWLNSSHRLELGTASGSNEFTEAVVFDNTMYYLRAIPKEDRSEADFYLGVRPDPLGAPEPGTLALLLVGLVPVGARAIRRRKA